LHDYISSLGQDNVIQIIVGFVKNYPELADNRLLETLAESGNIDIEGMREALNEVDKTTLINWAIAAEEYDREKSGVQLLGGLHDYAYSLTADNLVGIIIGYIQQHPELSRNGAFQNMVGDIQAQHPSLFGGFLDYVRNFSREEMIKLGLAGESYDRAQRKIQLLGGLHDYIDSLDNGRIMKIVMDYVRQYPELNNPGTLENLAAIPLGGFDGYLKSQTKSTLRQMALAVDSYLTAKLGKKGGIHDYVWRLGADDLVKYLLDEAQAYPELRDASFLENLLVKYPDNGNKAAIF